MPGYCSDYIFYFVSVRLNNFQSCEYHTQKDNANIYGQMILSDIAVQKGVSGILTLSRKIGESPHWIFHF